MINKIEVGQMWRLRDDCNSSMSLTLRQLGLNKIVVINNIGLNYGVASISGSTVVLATITFDEYYELIK